MLQNRFKYAWKHLKTNTTSLINSGKIETKLALIKSRQQVGCSISKIQEFLGVSKSTISVALKNHTRKQCNCTLPIGGKIVRKKHKDLINAIISRNYKRISPNWSFKYNRNLDTYRICYALPSIIKTESYLTRKRKKVAKQSPTLAPS